MISRRVFQLFRPISTSQTGVSVSPFRSSNSSLINLNCACLSSSFSRIFSRSQPQPDVIKINDEDSSLVKTEDGVTNESLVSVRGPLPLITKRELNYLPYGRTLRQAWVENLDTTEEKKLGLVDLHPDVFGTFPRIELIHANIRWQMKYKKVNWDWAPTRAEVKGSNRKPWPQKGTGRSRHGHRKSPIWHKAGRAHGPRGPKTYFFMLPYYKRIHGLCSTLSVKFAQDDLKIVDNLDIPTTDPQYLEDLVAQRHWGVSVLFVDDSDIAPKNLALATDYLGHMNIMPVYGLNVFSMLKHETLVLTLAAVDKLEEKLLLNLNRHDPFPPSQRKIPGGHVLQH